MKLVLPLCALLSLTACREPYVPMPQPTPTPTPHNTNMAEQAACAFFQDGPAVAVKAASTEEAAPEVKADHKRYDIALPPTGANPGGTGGFVKFEVPRTEEWSFLLTKDVPLLARDASGLALTVVEFQPKSAFCPEIKANYIHLFDAGPVTIEFGPTNEPSLSLVIEASHPSANN